MMSRDISSTTLFRRAAERDPRFRDACELIARNTRGRYWICGGYVFRTLARERYGTGQNAPDIDIMTEKRLPAPVCPEGWNLLQNRYGNHKFVRRDGLKVDVWCLHDMHGIRTLGLRTTLRNYLRCTPLTVQSIVYDVTRQRVIGAVGIRALASRTIAINHLVRAQQWSHKYGTPLERMILSKAQSIGFTPIYDYPHHR